MKKTLILCILLTMPLWAQQKLTLNDAIKLGLQNNFDIRIARNSAEIAENNRGKGKAGFMPSLDASGGANLGETDTRTNSPFSFGSLTNKSWNGQIALSWTLFDGMKMFVDKKRYDELAERGRFQARFNIENAVVFIMQAYYNVVQQQQLLDVAERTLNISAERLKKEETRNRIGGASSTDLMNARVSYNNDRSQKINQELRLQIAVKDLNIALGMDPLTSWEVEEEIVIPLLDMTYEEIQRLAQEQNSALAVARKDKIVADKTVELNRSPFYPRLAIQGSYSYTDQTLERQTSYDISSQTKNMQAALTLSWNLFNGFRNSIDLQNAQLEAKNKSIALERAKNLLAGLLREKYDTFQKRLELAKIEEENVRAAAQNLELNKERYNLGSATSLEFRDAQTKLVRAEATLINARYQARISRLEIDQLIGRLGME